MHCRWYPSMPCRGLQEGGIPACLTVSRPTPRGEVEGSGQGVPGRGKLRGLSMGRSPGRNWGRGSPGPHWGGLQAHTQGDLQRGVCIPDALRQTPPQWLLLPAVRILLECIFVLFQV